MLHVKEFIDIVEEIRKRRQNQMPSHPEKSFTINELEEMAYPGYTDLKRGRIKNFPPRAVIIGIAEYLECTLEESNRLLTSAGYAPVYMPLTGDTLQTAIQLADSAINYMPFPAFYITRAWDVLGWNKYAEILFDVTADDMKKIPDTERNVLQLIFDKAYPIYERLHADELVWEYTAKLNIYGFKYTNLMCAHEDWYQNRVIKLSSLFPKFKDFWKEVNVDSPMPVNPKDGRHFPTYSTKIKTRGEEIWVFGTHSSLGNFDYPFVVSYMPYGEEDQRKFAKIGLPTPQNGWASS